MTADPIGPKPPPIRAQDTCAHCYFVARKSKVLYGPHRRGWYECKLRHDQVVKPWLWCELFIRTEQGPQIVWAMQGAER